MPWFETTLNPCHRQRVSNSLVEYKSFYLIETIIRTEQNTQSIQNIINSNLNQTTTLPKCF
jgi:hypothetical protein